MNRWISTYFPNSDGRDLFLPGTHHSAMNQMLLLTNINKYKVFEGLDICFQNLKDLTITQKYSVYDQLNMGVRVFDIRTTIYNKQLYVQHTFLGPKLDSIIDQFLRK